ncbi:transporter [Fibrobacterota bacterium]
MTPAKGRWIARTQVRYASMSEVQSKNEMHMWMFPVMAAYGVLPQLMVMVKIPMIHSRMEMMSNKVTESGPGDVLLLAKYRLYRLNTRTYTMGFAATIGLEAPLGSEEFSSDSWDGRVGIYGSFRRGPWALDLASSYVWNGMGGLYHNNVDPGDEVSLDLGAARQFAIGPEAALSWAPVVEANLVHAGSDKPDNGAKGPSHTLMTAGLGSKLSASWIIFEYLVQLPVWQELESGHQLDWKMLAGVRILL